MDVIADFDVPDLGQGREVAEVLAEFEDGRAVEVAFVLDAAPIKDEYTLAYDWDGDDEVTWTLVEAKMLKAMDGAYSSTTAATASPRSPTGSPSTSRSR